MASGDARHGGVRATLQIFATTDLHAQLRPYNYHSRMFDPGRGLASALSLVEALRDPTQPSVLLDNGDFLSGGALGDRALRRVRYGLNPVIAAMNAARYDAVTLGNHELDEGPDVLIDELSGRTWPIVTATPVRRMGAVPADDETFMPPWCVIERRVADGSGGEIALRIGVIGVTPVGRIERETLNGALLARDMEEAMRGHLPRLHAAGVDVVVALCHAGLPGPEHNPHDAALDLARIPGIDAMILGHRHQVFPGPGNPEHPAIDAVRGRVAGVPAVMPGFRGSHVGHIRLSLVHDGRGWSVAGARSSCRSVGAWSRRLGLRPQRAVIDATETAHRDWIDETRTTIGTLRQPLHTYFVRMGRCAATHMVARAQRVAMAPVLEAAGLGHLPQIGVAAPVRSGGFGGPHHYVDVPAGRITRGDTTALYPYHNTISAIRLRGAELALWLERSVSAFHSVMPGVPDTPLVDPGFPAFDFDLPENVTFTVDLSRPPRFGPRGTVLGSKAARVSDLRIAGRSVDPGAEIVIVTNSFRCLGGGAFPCAGRERIVATSDVDVRTAIADMVAAGLPALPSAHFRFRRVPGASALFDTGQRAVDHLDELGDLPIEQLGHSPQGFLRLRIDLDQLPD